MDHDASPIRALDTAGAARYIGLAPKTLANRRSPSSPIDGPPWRNLGPRGKVVYLIADLDAYLDAQPARSRKQGG